MMQNALINIPKIRLLLVPEQDSSLRDQGHHVLEARVVKINEAFVAAVIIKDIEPYMCSIIPQQCK